MLRKQAGDVQKSATDMLQKSAAWLGSTVGTTVKTARRLMPAVRGRSQVRTKSGRRSPRREAARARPGSDNHRRSPSVSRARFQRGFRRDQIFGGAGTGGFGRLDPRRPRTCVAFRRPLACGIDAHLAPVRRQIGGIVQIVHRSPHHLDIAQRIHVRADDPGDLADVLHIHVLVDHDYRLREHQLAEAPEGVHDLSRVAGKALVDRDEHEVVKDALRREVHVDDFGKRLADHRQEDPLARQAQIVVLHRRHTDDRRQIGGPLAPGDAGQMEHRIVVGLRIEPGVIAKRSLAPPLAGIDVALRARCASSPELRGPR